jgi:hypothetical protein
MSSKPTLAAPYLDAVRLARLVYFIITYRESSISELGSTTNRRCQALPGDSRKVASTKRSGFYSSLLLGAIRNQKSYPRRAARGTCTKSWRHLYNESKFPACMNFLATDTWAADQGAAEGQAPWNSDCLGHRESISHSMPP